MMADVVAEPAAAPAAPPCYDLTTYATMAWSVDVLSEGKGEQGADVALSTDGTIVAVVMPKTHTVETYSAATGAHMATWGYGKGYRAGQFNTPVAICATPSGGWCVAEWGNLRVQELTGDGKHVRFWMEENSFCWCEGMWGVVWAHDKDYPEDNGPIVGVDESVSSGRLAQAYVVEGDTKVYNTRTTFETQLPGARVHLDIDPITTKPYTYNDSGQTSGGGIPRYMGRYTAMAVNRATGDAFVLYGGTLRKLVR